MAYVCPQLDLMEIIESQDELPIYEAEGRAALTATVAVSTSVAAPTNIIVYTDNTAVLYYLRKGRRLLFTNTMYKDLYFVIIKNPANHVSWEFVPTAHNPADRPSRTIV